MICVIISKRRQDRKWSIIEILLHSIVSDTLALQKEREERVRKIREMQEEERKKKIEELKSHVSLGPKKPKKKILIYGGQMQ